MIRRVLLRPDHQIQTPWGPLDAVSREQIQQALLDGEATVAVTGGHLSLVTERAATGVDGEMVTVAAVLEWKDRTDARPQPEKTQPLPVPAESPDVLVAPGQSADDTEKVKDFVRQVMAEMAVAAAPAEAPEPKDSGSDNGLLPLPPLVPLAEEDVSAIPASKR